MTRALAAGLCALWALSACNVASVQEQPNVVPQNQCMRDSDCAVGSCGGTGTCRAAKGTFDTILFEISPPADASSIAGVQFLKPVKDVLQSEGMLDLQLDLVAHVSGEVTTSPDYCTPKFLDPATGKTLVSASDRSIPALVTILPSTAALGLFSSPVAAQATIPDQISWSFRLNVPQGDYDIYIQPQHQPTAECPVPPQLLRAHAINGTVNLNVALPVPQTFEFDVSWPLADGGLDGWSVDMLDPISGRAISNSVPLVPKSNHAEYVANLAYLPVVGDTTKVEQFVRLSPPDGVTAPVLLFARSALGLFSASSGTIDQLTSLPTSVHIAGQVTARVTPAPVAATISLVATKLIGIDPGILASFVRTVSAGPDGTFELDVLPGTYRVSAVPSGSATSLETFAEANTIWDVGTSPDVQAGKVIELNDTLPINGDALDPSGRIDMTGAQVQAVASPASIATDVLHQALGETAYVPRAASTTVGADPALKDLAAFKLGVDTGTYDFSVRPRASSGYAWLVTPSLPVGTTPTTSNGSGLGRLILPLPVVYSGNLTVPGATADSSSAVPGALISAYLYMKGGAYTADPTEADSVLQIAESRSDATGAFEILIPAALNAAPQ
jgi:hypothetical protein